MDNEISKRIERSLNSDGDLIVEQREENDATVKVIKYGIIKLQGDRTEYRVSYKTLSDIVNKPEKFSGDVIIPELHLKVPIKQIVFQQFRDEEIHEVKSFTNLPYERVVCGPSSEGEKLRVTEMSELEANKSRGKYWLATLHYITSPTEEKLYDCEFNHCKEALLMCPSSEENYPPVISRIFRYGQEQFWGKKKVDAE